VEIFVPLDWGRNGIEWLRAYVPQHHCRRDRVACRRKQRRFDALHREKAPTTVATGQSTAEGGETEGGQRRLFLYLIYHIFAKIYDSAQI
jgi:hypothetical protein